MPDDLPRSRRLICVLLLVVPVALLYWLAMMLVHELGHALGAKLTGATIVSLDIRPGKISSIIVLPNPRPSFVLWAGFLFGWIFPFIGFPFWNVQRFYVGRLLQGFAHFCLVAGGTYLAVGGGEQLSDTGKLITLGWPHLLLMSVGATVAIVGYRCLRQTFIDTLDDFKAKPPNALSIAFWWSLLVVWYSIQSAVATVII